MTVQMRNEPKETVLLLEGTFAATDVGRLHGALDEVARERPGASDFHLVRLVNDAAVARLAEEIGDRPGHVTLVGLPEHHRRLLRYVASVERPAN